MRSALLLSFAALSLFGCGGQGGGQSASPFFQVSSRSVAHQDVSGGFDPAGNPVGIVFDDRNESMQVRTQRGAHSFSLKGKHVIFGLGIDGTYASFYTFEGIESGGLLVNADTGESLAFSLTAVASDGDRVIVDDGGSSYALATLGVDGQTSIAVPSGYTVSELAGDFVLLSKDEGEIPGSSGIDLGSARKKRVGGGFGPPLHYYSASRLSLSGGATVNYALPDGMAFTQVESINNSGEAAGLAYPTLGFQNPALVRWDRNGVPTVLSSSAEGFWDITIANDGRVFVADDVQSAVQVFNGSAVRRLDFRLPSGASIFVSRDGRSLMVEDDSVSRIAFYRTPLP